MINKQNDKHVLRPFEDTKLKTQIEISGSDMKAFIELGKTLKRIHVRLAMEGYIIEHGKIYKP
jgi:hypothetical protein